MDLLKCCVGDDVMTNKSLLRIYPTSECKPVRVMDRVYGTALELLMQPDGTVRTHSATHWNQGVFPSLRVAELCWNLIDGTESMHHMSCYIYPADEYGTAWVVDDCGAKRTFTSMAELEQWVEVLICMKVA